MVGAQSVPHPPGPSRQGPGLWRSAAMQRGLSHRTLGPAPPGLQLHNQRAGTAAAWAGNAARAAISSSARAKRAQGAGEAGGQPQAPPPALG